MINNLLENKVNIFNSLYNNFNILKIKSNISLIFF